MSRCGLPVPLPTTTASFRPLFTIRIMEVTESPHVSSTLSRTSTVTRGISARHAADVTTIISSGASPELICRMCETRFSNSAHGSSRERHEHNKIDLVSGTKPSRLLALLVVVFIDEQPESAAVDGSGSARVSWYMLW